MKPFASLLILLTLAQFLPAQVNRDSLSRVWADETQPDTNRLEAIHYWAWDLKFEEPDSFYTLARKELGFAQSTGNKFWEARAFNLIGVYYYTKGDYAEAYTWFRRSLSLFIEFGDLKKVSNLNSNIGLIFKEQGNYLRALEYIQQSLAINEQLKDSLGLASDYVNLANIYLEQEAYNKALEYYEKSLEIKKNNNEDLSLVYNNMGAVYSRMGEEYYLQALDYYEKSLAIREENKDNIGIAVNLNNIGQLYAKLGDYEKAEKYLLSSIEFNEKLREKSGIATAWYVLGDLANEKQDHPGAVKWCNQSLELSRQLASPPLERRACYCLYRAHKSMGQTAKALAYHEEYKLLTDSLQQEELEIQLASLEFGRKVLADSLANEELRLKTELAHQTELRRKSMGSTLILLAALVLLLFALAFLSRMNYFQKSSQRFQDKAQELEKQQLITEIALLKTQINPHFLFNSLSILSSLVHHDADLSEKFIQQLSKSYRYILDQRDQSLVSLATELEFIKAYTFLLKIRFEDKFDIRYNLPEETAMRYKVAPLTLQLLIENAVKHNRMSKREPLVINVDCEDSMLLVKNRMQTRMTAPPSTGMGLDNIRNSYALLADRPVWAGVSGEEFVVKVPLIC
ncbi:MAG: tetratricopeptide repeat protein [Saprospiraceae bacterium]